MVEYKSKKRGKIFLKTISSIVVLCFFVQDIAWAANGTPLWAVMKGNRVLQALSKDFTNLSKITIPKDYGIIKDIHNAGSKKIIINIQDAHANLGAQESISRLIDGLVKDYNLKLITLEGARGYVDTSSLQSYPDDKIRKDIADYFLQRGKINAAEYYKICSDSGVKLYGVEDASLYKENVNCYIDSLKNKGNVHKAVITLKKTVSDLKKEAYSKSLQELDEKRWDYKAESTSFKEYWKYLGRLSRSLRVDISGFNSVEALLEASELEERIDFKKAEEERSALVELLTKSLSKNDIEVLLSESLNFRLGKIQSSAYHNRLRELTLSCNIDISLYPTLSLYTDYINMHDRVVADDLFDELDELIRRVQEKMFKNDDERLLADISRRADIIIDLLDAKILNKDLDYYKSHRLDFMPQNIAQDIAQLLVKYNVQSNLVPEIRVIAEALPNVERFYEYARKRDEAMLRNTIQKMENDGRSLAVMVTGGFHTRGISELLRENDISYMVVLPKFSPDALERSYDDIILNKKQPFEEVLSQGEYYLASPSIYSNLINNKTALTSFATSFLLGAGKADADKWAKAFARYFSNISSIDEVPGVVAPENLNKLIENAQFLAHPQKTATTLVMLGDDVFTISRKDGQLRIDIADADDKEFMISSLKDKGIEATAAPFSKELTDELRSQQEKFSTTYKDEFAEKAKESLFERKLTQLKDLYHEDRGNYDITLDKAKRIYESDADRLDRLEAQDKLLKESKAEALRDDKHDIGDFCYAQERLKEEAAIANEADLPLSFIIFSFRGLEETTDKLNVNLKRILFNETSAIVKGALLESEKLAKDHIRAEDVVAWWGDRSFAIILPLTNLKDAEAVSKRVDEVIRKELIGHMDEPGSDTIPYSISAGVAEYKKGETAEELARRAEKALYSAERVGGNRIVSGPNLTPLDEFYEEWNSLSAEEQEKGLAQMLIDSHNHYIIHSLGNIAAIPQHLLDTINDTLDEEGVRGLLSLITNIKDGEESFIDGSMSSLNKALDTIEDYIDFINRDSLDIAIHPKRVFKRELLWCSSKGTGIEGYIVGRLDLTGPEIWYRARNVYIPENIRKRIASDARDLKIILEKFREELDSGIRRRNYNRNWLNQNLVNMNNSFLTFSGYFVKAQDRLRDTYGIPKSSSAGNLDLAVTKLVKTIDKKIELIDTKERPDLSKLAGLQNKTAQILESKDERVLAMSPDVRDALIVANKNAELTINAYAKIEEIKQELRRKEEIDIAKLSILAKEAEDILRQPVEYLTDTTRGALMFASVDAWDGAKAIIDERNREALEKKKAAKELKDKKLLLFKEGDTQKLDTPKASSAGKAESRVSELKDTIKADTGFDIEIAPSVSFLRYKKSTLKKRALALVKAFNGLDVGAASGSTSSPLLEPRRTEPAQSNLGTLTLSLIRNYIHLEEYLPAITALCRPTSSYGNKSAATRAKNKAARELINLKESRPAIYKRVLDIIEDLPEKDMPDSTLETLGGIRLLVDHTADYEELLKRFMEITDDKEAQQARTEALDRLLEIYRDEIDPTFERDSLITEAQFEGAEFMSTKGKDGYKRIYELMMGGGKTQLIRYVAMLLLLSLEAELSRGEEFADKIKQAKKIFDVIVATTTPDHAKEHAKQAAEFLCRFGRVVGAIYADGEGKEREGILYSMGADGKLIIEEHVAEERVLSEAHLIYGVFDNNRFRVLKEQSQDPADNIYLKGQHIVIMDEVDNLAEDAFGSPCIISDLNAYSEEELADIEAERARIAKANNIALQLKKENKDEYIDTKNEANKVVKLTALGLDRARELLGMRYIGADWTHLISMALRAQVCYEDGVDYEEGKNEKGEDEIRIRDQGRGITLPGRRWEGGLHAALEAKHNITPQIDGKTVNMVSLGEFEELPCILGLLGTTGTTTSFLEDVLGFEIKTPSEQPNEMHKVGIAYLYAADENSEEQRKEDFEDTIVDRSKMQGILAKVRSPGRAKELRKALTRKGVETIIEYTMSDKYILDKNKKPVTLDDVERESGKAGTVTIITNNGSRSVDIKIWKLRGKIKKALEKAQDKIIGEGLLVVTDYADDKAATLLQTDMRGGRSGLPGEYMAFLSEKDPLFGKGREALGNQPSRDIAKIFAKARKKNPDVIRLGWVTRDDRADKSESLLKNAVEIDFESILKDMRSESEKQDNKQKLYQQKLTMFCVSKKRNIQGMRDAVYRGEVTDELRDFLKGITDDPEKFIVNNKTMLIKVFEQARSELLTAFSDAQHKIQNVSSIYDWGHAVFKQEDISHIKKATQIGYDDAIYNARKSVAEEISGSAQKISKPGKLKSLLGDILGIAGMVLLFIKLFALFNVKLLGLTALASYLPGLAILVPITGIAVLVGFLISYKRPITAARFLSIAIMLGIYGLVSKIFKYFLVTTSASLAAGSIASKISAVAVPVWGLSNALAVVLVIVIISLGFKMLFTKIANLNKIDNTQQKFQELLMGIDEQSPREAAITMLKFAVQTPLRLLAQMGPVAALMTLVSAAATTTGLPYLVPLAIVMGVAGLISSYALYLMNREKIDKERPSSAKPIQRVFRTAAFVLTGAVGIFLLGEVAVGSGLAMLILAPVAVLGVSIYSFVRTFRSSNEAYQSIEKGPNAQRQVLIGTALGLIGLKGLMMVAAIAQTHGLVLALVSIVPMVPFAVLGALYFVAMPLAAYLYGSAHRDINNISAAGAGAMTLGAGISANVRGVAIALGALGTAATIGLKALVALSPIYGNLVVGALGLAGIVTVVVYYSYSKWILKRTAEGEKAPKPIQVLRSIFLNPKKLISALNTSGSVFVGGLSLGFAPQVARTMHDYKVFLEMKAEYEASIAPKEKASKADIQRVENLINQIKQTEASIKAEEEKLAQTKQEAEDIETQIEYVNSRVKLLEGLKDKLGQLDSKNIELDEINKELENLNKDLERLEESVPQSLFTKSITPKSVGGPPPAEPIVTPYQFLDTVDTSFIVGQNTSVNRRDFSVLIATGSRLLESHEKNSIAKDEFAKLLKDFKAKSQQIIHDARNIENKDIKADILILKYQIEELDLIVGAASQPRTEPAQTVVAASESAVITDISPAAEAVSAATSSPSFEAPKTESQQRITESSDVGAAPSTSSGQASRPRTEPSPVITRKVRELSPARRKEAEELKAALEDLIIDGEDLERRIMVDPGTRDELKLGLDKFFKEAEKILRALSAPDDIQVREIAGLDAGDKLVLLETRLKRLYEASIEEMRELTEKSNVGAASGSTGSPLLEPSRAESRGLPRTETGAEPEKQLETTSQRITDETPAESEPAEEPVPMPTPSEPKVIP
ncbi:MAG: diguanylate cyclase, partial [Candidatus Omnitrophota bacterium]